MRIVQISGAYAGAQKTIATAIHKECISRGEDSYIFFAVGDAIDARIKSYENRLQSLFRRAIRKYLRKTPRCAYLQTKKLISHLRKIKPDLVHLHVLHHGYMDYEMLLQYLIREKIPVVYTMHDMWAFTGGCYYYTKEGCAQFQSGCKQCLAKSIRLDNPPSKTAKYFSLKKDLISKLDKVQFVAVSPWVADEMKKSFLAEYPTVVINNGIDAIVPSKYAIDKKEKDKTILLSVAAAWDERKGIYRIFEIARALGENYLFYLVGHASQALKDDAPSNIKFLGYIHRKEDLDQLYTNADLHLSASLEETFGMTFVEAAFAGTRSIGYASTAIKATLEGVRGVAVSELTADAMAKEIQRLVMQGDIKLSVSEMEGIVNQYSCDEMAKKYCDVYQTLLKRK